MNLIAAQSYAHASDYAKKNELSLQKWRFLSDSGLLVSGVTKVIIMRCAYRHRNYKDIIVEAELRQRMGELKVTYL